MSRLTVLFMAAAFTLSAGGLAACGSADEATTATPAPRTESVVSGGSEQTSTEATELASCMKLRAEDTDFRADYERLDCVSYRPGLCAKLQWDAPRYADYRCAGYHRAQARAKLVAAKERRAKRAAARRAKAKRVAAKRAGDKRSSSKATSSTSKRGGFGSTGKQRSSTSSSSRSSSRGTAGSSSSSGGSSAGSSRSSTRRR